MIGIHPDLDFEFTDFSKKYVQILESNGIAHEVLNVHQNDFWERVKQLDHFIFRYYQMHNEVQLANDILPVIEEQYGVNTFPNQKTCSHFDDKVKQYYMCMAKGLPFIPSYIHYDLASAERWINEQLELPIVFKSKIGAASDNVVLVHTKGQAKSLVREAFSRGGMGTFTFSKPELSSPFKRLKNRVRQKLEIKGVLTRVRKYRYWRMDKNYSLFQKFLPGNDFDTRITVIGDRAFGFRRVNRKNDFRSSGSGMIDHNPEAIDLNHVKNAFKASKLFGFQSMAYDFLYDENGNSQFCEMSYNYADWAVELCPGYWDENMNWHEGHFWPQYFQLMDLLNMPELIQPKMKNDHT